MDQEIIVAGLALVGSLSGTILPTAGPPPLSPTGWSSWKRR